MSSDQAPGDEYDFFEDNIPQKDSRQFGGLWEPSTDQWFCIDCGAEVPGFEPDFCCTTFANPESPCGCMGYPIDPPICSGCVVVRSSEASLGEQEGSDE